MGERGESQMSILTPDLQLNNTVAVATQGGCCVLLQTLNQEQTQNIL